MERFSPLGRRARLNGLPFAFGEDERQVAVEVRQRPVLAELREYLRGNRDTMCSVSSCPAVSAAAERYAASRSRVGWSEEAVLCSGAPLQ